MDAVGDVTHRHFNLGPTGKEWLEQIPANMAVQAADAVDGAAATHGEVGHVERLVGVVWIGTAQRQQLLYTDAQGILDMGPQPLFDKGRGEPIETGFDRRMGGEEVTGARDRQGDVERHTVVLHEAPGPFQHGEGGMALIEVADLGLQPQGPQQRQPPMPRMIS